MFECNKNCSRGSPSGLSEHLPSSDIRSLATSIKDVTPWQCEASICNDEKLTEHNFFPLQFARSQFYLIFRKLLCFLQYWESPSVSDAFFSHKNSKVETCFISCVFAVTLRHCKSVNEQVIEKIQIQYHMFQNLIKF